MVLLSTFREVFIHLQADNENIVHTAPQDDETITKATVVRRAWKLFNALLRAALMRPGGDYDSQRSDASLQWARYQGWYGGALGD